MSFKTVHLLEMKTGWGSVRAARPRAHRARRALERSRLPHGEQVLGGQVAFWYFHRAHTRGQECGEDRRSPLNSSLLFFFFFEHIRFKGFYFLFEHALGNWPATVCRDETVAQDPHVRVRRAASPGHGAAWTGQGPRGLAGWTAHLRALPRERPLARDGAGGRRGHGHGHGGLEVRGSCRVGTQLLAALSLSAVKSGHL